MKSIIKFTKRTYKRVIHSIAFYPVIISICFFVFALLTISIENLELVKGIKDDVPYLFIEDFNTARSILSTFIAGIISLTVFSFTMVMVVLNQASANFSPGLLPNLTSNKRHQIILGIYIGTLLYCIIILISHGSYGGDSNQLGLSTMFATVLGLACIGFFILFIHNISEAVQIQNIIKKIFKKCCKYLERELQNEEPASAEFSQYMYWKDIKSNKTGYYKGIDISLLEDSLKKKNNQIEILPYIDQHIWKGDPLLRVKEPLSEKETELLLFCIDISMTRHNVDSSTGGILKLMEVVVKAMSPGINDPGTAIEATNKIGQLIHKSLQLPPKYIQKDKNCELLFIKNNIGPQEILRKIIEPIRYYSKRDNAVSYELIKALKYIANSSEIPVENQKIVLEELEAFKMDLENNTDNMYDRKHILELFNG